MNDIAAKQRLVGLGAQAYGDVAGCMPRGRFDGQAVVERVSVVYEHGLPRLNHGQHTIVENITLGGHQVMFGVFFVPAFQLFALENIAGVAKRRYPPSVDQLGVPADVVGMKMRAHDEVDLVGVSARSGKAFQPGLIAHVKARVGGSCFVIANARVDEDLVVRRGDQPAVNARTQAVSGGVVKMRHDPLALRFQHFGLHRWKHAGTGEAGAVVILDTSDFYVADAQALVAQVYVQGCSGCHNQELWTMRGAGAR